MLNLTNIIDLLGSDYLIFAVEIIAICAKLLLFCLLIFKGIRVGKTPLTLFFLLSILIASMFENISWLASLIGNIFPTTISSNYQHLLFFFNRIAWAFTITQYQSIALFLDSLSVEKFTLSIKRKLILFISLAISFSWIYIAISQYQLINRDPTLYNYALLTVCYGFIIILLSTHSVLKKLRANSLPRILKKQLSLLIPYIIAPWLFFDTIQILCWFFGYTQQVINPITCISTILLTYAIYYCARKMVGLRFLNLKDHVESIKKNPFIDGFKHVLEQLGHATTIKELSHITQTFFKDTFAIPVGRTHLYVRQIKPHKQSMNSYPLSRIESEVETFIAASNSELLDQLQHTKILIHDELAFSDFYQTTAHTQALLTFLDRINADIFLPIYEKNAIIGYIIIERFARIDRFYTNVERDEMLVLTNYLSNLINLIENKNFESLMQQEKEIKEELYSKHQEINQYKESIRSFLRNSEQKSIAIVFYKNRRFVCANQTAKELILVNLNTQDGHSLTKAFKQIARDVEQYKTAQIVFTKDLNGNKLILSGVPSIEQNSVIITAYYPEIADIVKKQIDLLKDPSKWDYLLYLETTKSGQLINQLVPGSGETLLNFKIDLLKTALSNKAALLEINDEDLLPTVEILHHISLREHLHVLQLNEHNSTVDTAIKLFGINPIFKENNDVPLLKKLNETGTLFIQNVEYLDPELQNYLAEFLRYGYYRIFKSDTKVPSNVRIICSTNRDLQIMVHHGTFSSALFNELKKAPISMPSLLTLPPEELSELAEGFSEQTMHNNELKNLLELTDREQYKIAIKRPVSLHELKQKVQQLVLQKSKKNNVYDETEFNPSYEVSDPHLVEAARLGKHALRDRKIMTQLWEKFQNQSKLATFLGVNRSSINRRCKEYNLK